MKASIQRLFILASLATGLLSLSGAAAALEFECSLPGDIRFLRVDVPGEIHLCEVSVTSQLSNERRVMWYADNDTQFCSAKVYELRDRYVEEFSFTCKEGEDRDGIDRLSPRHRTILDGQLKALLTSAAATTNDSTAPGSAVDTDEGDAALASSEDENARETPPVLAVRTVRAVASSALPGPGSLLALQFFLTDGSDLLRIVADEDERRRTLVSTDDLLSFIPEVAGYRLSDAFINTLSASGMLELRTLLRAPDDSVCEGRVTLQTDDGALIATSAHRHLCGSGLSGDLSVDAG